MMNYRYLFIFTVVLFALPSCSNLNQNKSVSSVPANETKTNSNEFILTLDESNALSKWKNLSMDSLLSAADSGDSGALYMLGLTHLFGYGIPVNVKGANLYFAKAASFGFAPAIDKLKFMYMEDYPAPWLSLVYLNLTIAFGHNELTGAYHKLIDKMDKSPGLLRIRGEIERLALQKFKHILKHQDELKKSTDKSLFVLKMNDITAEDWCYDSNYWEKIFTGNQVEVEKADVDASLRSRLLQIPFYYDGMPDYLPEFIDLLINVLVGISTNSSFEQISDDDIIQYAQKRVPALLRTKEGQSCITSELKKIIETSMWIKDVMDSVIKENNDVLPFDLEAQVNMRTQARIDKLVQEFKALIYN